MAEREDRERQRDEALRLLCEREREKDEALRVNSMLLAERVGKGNLAHFNRLQADTQAQRRLQNLLRELSEREKERDEARKTAGERGRERDQALLLVHQGCRETQDAADQIRSLISELQDLCAKETQREIVAEQARAAMEAERNIFTASSESLQEQVVSLLKERDDLAEIVRKVRAGGGIRQSKCCKCMHCPLFFTSV